MTRTAPDAVPAERIGDMRCGVGESPVWHPAEQALYWTDIPGRTLWRWRPSDARVAHWSLPQQAGCIAMREDGWLLAMENGIHELPELHAGQPAPAPRQVAAVAHAAAGMRFNDGRCDRQGRFWAGTMVQDMALAQPHGRLYRYAAGRLDSPVDDDLIVSNGMAFSPDGKTMYLSDSHGSRQVVWAYDYDIGTGVPHNRRVFIPALPAGRPDGAAIDADGCYWICGNEAGRVYRYTPQGRLDRTLTVPVPRVAMCAFGEADLSTLFVTSIRAPGTPAEALDGAVYALRPGVRGLEETAYAG
ncbi:IclR family transcriptional regulator [Bordetella ansorpii]|uniref:IclR family transcriptional regulator n=1 Tax=Bordetella ansorpii TaxID=288768 RepID=A0A157P0K4_9BORD|nr:SMP-30/gluconolactonase/LRE family protein [Bordetella ansorpii]SAI27172.1 IclR family transcriptional regulator [Bordetella ansorpii]